MSADHLRLLADETRLRLLHLLAREPLAVVELQEILDLGQSTISSHLAKLKQSGLVHDVAEGAARRYRLRADPPTGLGAAWSAVAGLTEGDPSIGSDRTRLDAWRRQRGQDWVHRVAGSLHREYAPGRTWASLCQGLLALADFGRCIDIGAGDGAMIELLAPSSRSLVCVDPSPAMTEAARARIGQLRAAGVRLGEVRLLTAPGEAVPLGDGAADTVLFLQSLQYIADPAAALAEAARLLAPGGRVLALTLAAHAHDEAERYGHRHRGFAPTELTGWCAAAGLARAEVVALPAESRPPHFQPLVLTAIRPAPTRP